MQCEYLVRLQKRHDALKLRESQLSKQVEDLQKDCLRNLADRQNEVVVCMSNLSVVGIPAGRPAAVCAMPYFENFMTLRQYTPNTIFIFC